MNSKVEKILSIVHVYPSFGGMGTSVTMLSNYLSEEGYDVTLLAMTKDETARLSDKIPLNASVALLYMPDDTDMNSSENLLFVSRLIRKENFSFVLNQGAFSEVYRLFEGEEQCRFINILRVEPSWWVVRKRNIRWKTQVVLVKGFRNKVKAFCRYAGLHCIPGLAKVLADRELKRKIGGADAFVVLAEKYKSWLEKNFYGGRVQQKIVAIPNPVWPFGMCSSKDKIVMYAGRLSRADKRVDRLLRIWKSIEKEVPAWSLHIVGKGPEEKALRKLAGRLSLQRVRFCGPVWDEQLYSRASVLCLTSSYEGFGMVLVECQRAGMVPVAFDCSDGVRSVIRDDYNGKLVPCFDEKKYAAELLKLLEDDNYRIGLSAHAQQEAGKYEMKNIGPLWLSLLGGLSDTVSRSKKISVIIPSYKPGDYLYECLQSVFLQTFPAGAFEVLLVLNGCNEPYVSEIENFIRSYREKFNIRLIQSDKKGASHARNIGLDHASGKYIAFLDDDDCVSPDYLEKLCAEAGEDTVAVSDVAVFRKDTGKTEKDYLSEAFDRFRNIPPDSLVKCREFLSCVWGKLIPACCVGGCRFEEDLVNGQDSVFMFAVSNRIRRMRLTEVLYYRRLRANSLFRRKRTEKEKRQKCFRMLYYYTKYYFHPASCCPGKSRKTDAKNDFRMPSYSFRLYLLSVKDQIRNYFLNHKSY